MSMYSGRGEDEPDDEESLEGEVVREPVVKASVVCFDAEV